MNSLLKPLISASRKHWSLAKALSLATYLLCSSVSAAPLDTLSGGQTGRIEFNSITPPDRWQFVRKNMSNTKPVVVYGDLIMPSQINGKVPAVIISPGSGGVSAKLYDVWGKSLNDAGIAVFIVDSFKPREIAGTTNNQGLLDVSANVADALNALKLLATHPQIDADRIFSMGGSRGGSVAFETHWDMVRKAVIDTDLKFAGNIPLYQGNCSTRFRYDRGDTNKAPILALLGGADNGTIASACVDYYTELKAGGTNIRWKVYPGAHHGFDGTGRYEWLPQGVHANNCTNEVHMINRQGAGLGEARNYKTGEPINGFAEWSKQQRECNGRGYAVEGNATARNDAIKEVIIFVKGL